MYDLLCGTGSALESHNRVGSLESGTLLSQAYEAYLELHAPANISFEHAWFLALVQHDEVAIERCGVCGRVRLRDLLAKHTLAYGTCGPAVEAGARTLGLGFAFPTGHLYDPASAAHEWIRGATVQCQSRPAGCSLQR